MRPVSQMNGTGGQSSGSVVQDRVRWKLQDLLVREQTLAKICDTHFPVRLGTLFWPQATLG